MKLKNILLGTIFVFSSLFYSFWLSNHCRFKNPTICVDGYWLDHWLVNYSQGLTRRGLLGEIIKQLLGSELNIVVINLLCFVTILIIFLVIFSNLYQRINSNHGKVGIFFVVAVLAATPLTSVFFETLGDPLHLILLSYLIIIPIIISMESRLWRIFLTFVTVFISALIHEASLFLFMPAYLLAMQKDSSILRYKKSFTIFLLFLIPVVVILLTSSSMSDTKFQLLRESIRAVNPITGKIYQPDIVLKQSFLELLKLEAELYFSSYKSTFFFVVKPITTLWVPLCSFFVISRATKDRIFNTYFLKTWLFLMLCSFPLYVIAHDWGRFAIYSFWIAFYFASILTYTRINQKVGSFDMTKDYPAKSLYADSYIMALIILIFTVQPVWIEYRIIGIPEQSFIACLPAFFLGIILLIINYKKLLFIVDKEFYLSGLFILL